MYFNNMANLEKGVTLREITIRKPSSGMVEVIIRAQAELPNRMIRAEWGNQSGETVVTFNIEPSKLIVPNKIRKISAAVGGVDRLIVQEILPLQT